MNYANVQLANALISQLAAVNVALALVSRDNVNANPVTPQVTIAVSDPEGASVCVPINITDPTMATSAFQFLAQVLQEQAVTLQAQLTALQVTPT